MKGGLNTHPVQIDVGSLPAMREGAAAHAKYAREILIRRIDAQSDYCARCPQMVVSRDEIYHSDTVRFTARCGSEHCVVEVQEVPELPMSLVDGDVSDLTVTTRPAHPVDPGGSDVIAGPPGRPPPPPPKPPKPPKPRPRDLPVTSDAVEVW